ncbi:MAG: [FeFe] hydrogenase H-cluster maturation GTPase HydF [Bacillota bacterium]|nr:[FeFe] hydrogenase H-cluster maturation GTPase HydF [Bacillota bacterium]
MSLNSTPSAERLHIGFFGMRNAGKSSLVNAVTNQELSVVSSVKGTTTDPVQKAMELLPLGPILIIDTPGFDDEGSLGEMRVKRAKQILNRSDIAVLVVDASAGMSPGDRELLSIIKEKELPYIVVYNKADLLEAPSKKGAKSNPEEKIQAAKEAAAACGESDVIFVSASGKQGIEELKERLAALAASAGTEDRYIVRDLVSPGELVILVIPIDKSAPKGRLILPQQQVIRELLDAGCSVLTVRDTEFRQTLGSLVKDPALVITDSQVFKKIDAETPSYIPLTSFSILMARYKGFLKEAIAGVSSIRYLEDGDKVLISEGCTHHRQCEDIGTVKIPKWIKEFTGRDISVETSSGRDFPEDISQYKLIIHCGACMLNEKEVDFRRKCSGDQCVPFTNYGTSIAYMNGILERSLEIIPEAEKLLK